jgi:branched-chain amino acid transport system substrate-binding protein
VSGEAIVKAASTHNGNIRAGLLLEQTGWGDSNLETMRRALQDRNLEPVSLQRFSWGIGSARAAAMMANFLDADVNTVFMVANVEEGAQFVRAMADLPADKRIPIYSHWGITGGGFVDLAGADALRKVDLRVLQTRFSFLSGEPSNYARSRFEMLQELEPSIRDYKDLKPVSGFAHAHDLTMLLNQAAQDIKCSDPVASIRYKIRNNLEKLHTPIRGLVKTYLHPFSATKVNGDSSHEALSIDDLTLGRFGNTGEIYLEEQPRHHSVYMQP